MRPGAGCCSAICKASTSRCMVRTTIASRSAMREAIALTLTAPSTWPVRSRIGTPMLVTPATA